MAPQTFACGCVITFVGDTSSGNTPPSEYCPVKNTANYKDAPSANTSATILSIVHCPEHLPLLNMHKTFDEMAEEIRQLNSESTK